MSFSDFLALLSKYGIKSSLITAVLVVLYFLSKSQLFIHMSKTIFDKFHSKRKVRETDILNHNLFNYIDLWINSKIPTLIFSTEYRTIIFRKYLTIYLKKHKECTLSYINSKIYERMDQGELWKSILKLINDTIYEYENEMRNIGIPPIIIEKMKNKINDNINLTIDLLEGICNSDFYDSDQNLLKVYSILNIILTILENTVSSAEEICDSINGQLKGLSIKEGSKIYREP